MSVNATLVVVVGVLFAAGVYLILERSLARVLIGVILVSNGVNTLFLVASGRGGGAPIVGEADIGEMSDPLTQAMVLTAIVITLGVTAFLLAVAYRAWQLHQHDNVQDDVEDALIRRRAARDQASLSFDEGTGGTLNEEGADVDDEPAVTATGSRSGEPAGPGPEGEHP